MAGAQIRPTTEVSDVILDSMDRMFGQLVARLEGLSDDEYLWEPVGEMWSVRVSGDGTPIIDHAGDRDADPAPVPTIAWRLWHIAIDCFDEYTRRFGGDFADASAEWTVSADEALEILNEKWLGYRNLIACRNGWDELGDSWQHLSQHSVADMAMHASNELVHHGAEIALLRDLYRTSFTS